MDLVLQQNGRMNQAMEVGLIGLGVNLETCKGAGKVKVTVVSME
jgi:hypothetical protein